MKNFLHVISFVVLIGLTALNTPAYCAGDTLRIAVISDNHSEIGENSLCIEDIMQNVNFPAVDFLVNGGDFHLHGEQCPYRESIRRGMEGDGQPFGWNDLHLPYFMVYGNHDATSYLRNPDSPYFVPVSSKELGIMNPFYAFEYDNILFLFVQSALGNTRLMEEPQKEWLEQITSENKDKTTVLFTHRALFDSGTSGTRSRTYQYFQDTDTWWAGFFDNNPQISLYTYGHTSSGDPSHAAWRGVNIVKNAMMRHGDPNQMMLIEMTDNSLRVRHYNASTNEFTKTLMDDAVNSTYSPTGMEWFSNTHIAQDGEKFTWQNRMLAENYKLKLIGNGNRGRELVWQNNEFSFYSPAYEGASTLWIGYEEDENNQKSVTDAEKPYYYPGETGFVEFNGVDIFAAATTYETKHRDNDVEHEGGHIPWSTTPWAVPGKEYKIRVRMKADEVLDNAMDVSVKVLGDTLTDVAMEKTAVIENINLTDSWQWYEGTFTVPDNPDAWIIKTIWESKQDGQTCYLDEWSVQRADATGDKTADLGVTINGETHSVAGEIPDGEVHEFDLSSSTIQNDLDIEVASGGSRVGMFTIVYDKPYLWSDDVSMGINSSGTDQVNAHLEMVSDYTPNAAFVPLQPGVEIEGATRLNIKPGLNAAQVLEKSDLPGDFTITYHGEDETGQVPEAAESLFPGDGDEDMPTSTGLTWEVGPGSLSSDIYFGTSNPPEFVGNVDRTGLVMNYTPAEIDANKTYYWRVDAVNSNGTNEGAVWSFTTTSGTHYTVLDPCDEGTGWSTSNNMAVDHIEKKEGFASLSAVGSETNWFKKNFDPPVNSYTNESSGYLDLWLYISDVSAFDGGGQIEITSSGGPDTDEYSWLMRDLDLSNGWNNLHLKISEANKIGEPDLNAINFFRLYQHVSSSVTFYIDHLRFSGITSGLSDIPENLEEVPTLNIYPSPASQGHVTVETGFEGRNMTLLVRNAGGRLVYSADGVEETADIVVDDFAAGVYLISILEEGAKKGAAKLIVR